MQIQKIANFFDHQCFTFRILKCNMYLQNMKKVTKFAIIVPITCQKWTSFVHKLDSITKN